MQRPRLFGAMLGLAMLVAAPALAAEWYTTVRGWTVETDRFDDGERFCTASVARGGGEELFLMQSADGLLLVVYRDAWALGSAEIDVETVIDGRHRGQHAALLRDRAVLVGLGHDPRMRAALARGHELALRSFAGGRAVRVDLAGSAAALAALDACYDAHVARTHPFAAAPVDRDGVAATLEALLGEAGDEFDPRVTAREDEPGVFGLRTRFGTGEIVTLPGSTHEAVLAAGVLAVRGVCGGASALIEHEPHDLDGTVLQRSTLLCRASGHETHALVVSFADVEGGFVVLVDDPQRTGLGDAFTAALVEAQARRIGLELRLRAPSITS